ncbi:MAG: methyltransferase domain-containing protein [Thermodesulfobacteriota bacterium]|nr:methyltransferase domain-containing protein [Thermodesulfobacteriota bacterium]
MKHHICPWRLAYLFDNPLRRLLHNPKKILGAYVHPGMTVLDLGCGMGFFSLALARLVGKEGAVFSVDLQEEMLQVLKKRALRAGVADRIQTHRSSPEDLGLTARVDFILAFWMVHEVPDRAKLFRQLKPLLRASGHLLIAEPKIHVSAEDFQEALDLAGGEGWRHIADVRVRFSRAAVLRVSPLYIA